MYPHLEYTTCIIGISRFLYIVKRLQRIHVIKLTVSSFCIILYVF